MDGHVVVNWENMSQDYENVIDLVELEMITLGNRSGRVRDNRNEPMIVKCKQCVF